MTYGVRFPGTFATLGITAVLVYAAPVSADDNESAEGAARQHFQSGQTLYAEGKFDEARAEYEAAFQSSPLPDFAFNIAQCHRNLQHYDEAVFFFRKYLHLRPDATDIDAVQTLIAELQKEHEHDVALSKAKAKAKANPPLAVRVELLPKKPEPAAAHSSHKSWWLVGGTVVLVGAAATAFFLWPDSDAAPNGSLGRLDFPQ